MIKGNESDVGNIDFELYRLNRYIIKFELNTFDPATKVLVCVTTFQFFEKQV